jgi:hypothetical protein
MRQPHERGFFLADEVAANATTNGYVANAQYTPVVPERLAAEKASAV